MEDPITLTIPITYSVLHDKEYINCIKQLAKGRDRRRVQTEKNYKRYVSDIKKAANLRK
jgi:hypothetical protein